jgi:hypothetical protein
MLDEAGSSWRVVPSIAKSEGGWQPLVEFLDRVEVALPSLLVSTFTTLRLLLMSNSEA